MITNIYFKVIHIIINAILLHEKVSDAIHTNHVKMVVEVCGIIEIGFTLQGFFPSFCKRSQNAIRVIEEFKSLGI